MPKYTIRSGQNIYDVALTLHGSVEGIFDLLASNDELTMETVLTSGMELNYHDEFMVNKNISLWLKENGIVVKNGEHIYNHLDIEDFVKQHIQSNHQEQYDAVSSMSPDEQNMFWSVLCMPRMVIHQQGQLSTIRMALKPGRHLIIDWGDYSAPQTVEDTEEQEIEHCYKGLGTHIITFYGDFDFSYLNLKEVNGVYYPLSTISADNFETELEIADLNKLIITQ